MTDEEGYQEILRRLTNIEHQVTSIEQTAAFSARPNRETLLTAVDTIFGNRTRQAQAYLACNGIRSLSEICGHIGIKKNNATTILSDLEAEGLLGFSVDGSIKRYHKKQIDKTIGISKHLMERFHLTADGLEKGSA